MHLGSMKFKQRGREEQAEAEGAIVRRLCKNDQIPLPHKFFAFLLKITIHWLLITANTREKLARKCTKHIYKTYAFVKNERRFLQR